MITILKQKLNTAIIGCGNIHKAHADAIKNSKYAKLVAVVDKGKELKKLAKYTNVNH